MYLYPNILGYDKSAFVRMQSALGEAGAFGVTIEYPEFHNWYPLEIAPMGDCDLAEIKLSFGRRLALMGNIHTTAVMLMGTPEDVEREAKKCMCARNTAATLEREAKGSLWKK